MGLLGFIFFIAICKSIFGRHHHCHFFRGILGGIFLSWIFNRDKHRSPYGRRDWPYDGRRQWY